MSFSLSQVTRLKEVNKANRMSKKQLIAKCFTLIRTYENITDKVRDALLVYLNDRLKFRSCINLSVTSLNDIIVELLESCCRKEYKNITVEDVKVHEIEILKYIIDSIEHRNTKTLIFNYGPAGKDYRDMGTVKLFSTDDKTDEEIYNYFEARRQLYG